MDRVGQCKICGAYMAIQDGRLGPHKSIATGNDCRGRLPRVSGVEEYTVGWDHHPAEISAGQFESSRRRH
jgi:hypothetical protein